jgi:hypothetical protein
VKFGPCPFQAGLERLVSPERGLTRRYLVTDLVYLLLTIVVFAVLGLLVRGVERL